jgi:hypothetical protein
LLDVVVVHVSLRAQSDAVQLLLLLLLLLLCRLAGAESGMLQGPITFRAATADVSDRPQSAVCVLLWHSVQEAREVQEVQ